MNIQSVWLLLICSGLTYTSAAQLPTTDSSKLNLSKVYAHCLDADLKPVIAMLAEHTIPTLPVKERLFAEQFRQRFMGAIDSTKYQMNGPVDSAIHIFRKYWRAALLNEKVNEDSLLWNPLWLFLAKYDTAMYRLAPSYTKMNDQLKKYIHGKGLYTTNDIGKTGKLFDLLIWSKQLDTVYRYVLGSDSIKVNVRFMEKFQTLGWEQYATFGVYYPGGWATATGIYCVKDAYDLASEDFRISYLAHEGKHFMDLQKFPKLVAPSEKEYRAKLVELSLAVETIYALVDQFIKRGIADTKDGHGAANYKVITDLSAKVFKRERVTDLAVWKKTDVKTIQQAALALLKQSDASLE